MASIAERPAHARRPSYEYEDIPTTLSSSSSLAAPPPRPRVLSTPGSSHPASHSASPGRTTFASSPAPITITPSHSRKLSTNDTASSPFRGGFSVVSSASTSNSSLANGEGSLVAGTSAHARRHSRIHSKNLSIHFPRPGANPTPSIAEDGSQEVEAPVTIISSPRSASFAYRTSTKGHNIITPQSATFSATPLPPKRLGEGFTFGGRPPPNSAGLESISMGKSSSSQSSNRPSARRGHHHKHSLSHNFFSFMEPSPSLPPASPSSPAALTTSPSNASANAEYPISPSWGPISPMPASASDASTAFPRADMLPDKPASTLPAASLPVPSTSKSSSMFGQIMSLPTALRTKLAFSCIEFTIGALLWISGQQNGSLSCTGLGYWVVFDAMGVALTVYGNLVRRGGHSSLRLPYGPQRMEVVGLFAQVVYLLFSAVYVCKETAEHLLLTSSNSHHHHRTDEYEKFIVGVEFPNLLLILSSVVVALASLFFGNHFKLVDATGNFVPSPSSLLRSIRYPKSSNVAPLPSLSTNPFSLNPLVFALCLLSIDFWVAVDHQRPADLFLAGIEVLFTFWIAYPAAVALAKVLLQTAPDRGMPDGQMEALLRVMREIERHPNVLHLPAPHVWQLTAPSHTGLLISKSRVDDEHERDPHHHRSPLHSHSHQANGHANGEHRRPTGGSGPSLVVTIQLHVDKNLEDVECLGLTRWAWERCVRALGQGEEGITVGIVRG